MHDPRVVLVSMVAVIAMLTGQIPSLQVTAQTKPGCRSSCGGVDIPYPFGTADGGRECYYVSEEVPDQFVIYCDNSTNPPRPYFDSGKDLPMVDISVVNHEMLIMMFVAQECYSSKGNKMPRNSPWASVGTFLLSGKNRFTVVGCDTYAYFIDDNNGMLSSGCMSLCNDITEVTNGSCLGVGCCQTSSFPRNMRAFNITMGSLKNYRSVHNFNPCGFAFIAPTDYFNFSTASLKNITEARMPMVLDWAIGNETCDVAQRNTTSYMCMENTNCTDADDGAGYRCHCKEGYRGNPYLSGPDGCQDIDECETSNPCKGLCTNLPGSYNCSCPAGYEGDPRKDGCSPIENSKKSMSPRDITLGVSIGFLLLLLCASWLLLGLRQRKIMKERKKFYCHNGGLMLERLLSQHHSYVETLRVFSAEALKKATDNFDERRILGEGGQGTVYKGMVMNNRIVAIKKAKMLDRSQLNEFINEIIVLSQINHKNVVKLIGCCLETELPLLVYEFVTNGTLFEHLHGHGQDSALSSWRARLRVAVETAGALSYLHSDAGIPIIHRDVKSTNILLDENYTAKVSDFGASRLMPSDQAQLGTLVQGTLGYLDPEYFHSSQLTDKSDVYSFGVVLAELLTGMRAICFNRPEKERNLSLYFVLAVKEDRCLEVIDSRILDEGNAGQIKEVALLASRCLKIRGEDRPSMKEVTLELEGLLRATDVHPWRHQNSNNFEESEYLLNDFHTNYSNTDLVGTAGYEDTNQLVPFNIEDGR